MKKLLLVLFAFCSASAASAQSQMNVIDSSTNLITWLPIATNTSPSTAYDFVDGDAPGYRLRFYRVRQ